MSRLLAKLQTILMGIIGVLLLATPLAAQTANGGIAGTVTDSSGATLRGAQIKLTPGNITLVAGEDGIFSLPNIPAGKYTVTVSYAGFAPSDAQVEVLAGRTASLKLQVKVANASEEVLVTAERPHGEAEAINQEFNADNIVQVIPADVIRSLPNANVADAIGRLPAVTLYRIEGEGVYIQVRGTEPRLTNVTVDGITIPAPEPQVRQVRLDVIPSAMVDAIELNKTLSASQDGNGIGGSVNLRTKEAGERPTINFDGTGGYNSIMGGRASYDLIGTVGKRFLTNHKLGILGNIDFDYNGRGIDNIQPALDPNSTFAIPYYDNLTIREYRYYRYREGFDGSLDYKFNDNNQIYGHGFYTDLKDWGDKWYYSPISSKLTCSAATPSCYPTKVTSPKFYTSNKRPNASVGTGIVGGRHAFSNSLLTWQVSSSFSYEVDSAGNPKADFAWNQAAANTPNCNYIPTAQTDPNVPHFGNCDNTSSSPLLNPNYWTFLDITVPTGRSSDLQLTAQSAFSHYYHAHGHYGIFEAGFKFSNAHQVSNSTETVYDGWSSASAPTVAQLQDQFNSTNYFYNDYFGGQFGPVSNFVQTQAYTLANYSGNVDVQKTASDTYPNLYHTVEQIFSGYAMNTIDFGKLHLQTGLRIEATQMDTSGYYVTFQPASSSTAVETGACQGTVTATTVNCYVATSTTNNPGYIDFLPSVQVRYGLDKESNVRFVYARGVARPDPYQLIPYVTETDATSTTGSVSIGNPALRPEHANNFDLLYERYLQPLGLLTGGFFFKQLTAPQVQITLPAGLTPANFPGGYITPVLLTSLTQYPGYAITQYINGSNAYLWGVEVGFQQHFSYLPSVLKGLGLSANYSYTGSKLKALPLRTDSPNLIDASPNTFNISPTYDTKRFSARVGLAYNQASVFSYAYTSPTYISSADPSGLGPTGPSGDTYTLTHYQVDAQASYRFYKGFSAVVSGLNLNDEVFGYYTGSTQFVNQREFYHPTYSGGLRYNFASRR